MIAAARLIAEVAATIAFLAAIAWGIPMLGYVLTGVR